LLLDLNTFKQDWRRQGYPTALMAGETGAAGASLNGLLLLRSELVEDGSDSIADDIEGSLDAGELSVPPGATIDGRSSAMKGGFLPLAAVGAASKAKAEDWAAAEESSPSIGVVSDVDAE
jgi:hypothetical protein